MGTMVYNPGELCISPNEEAKTENSPEKIRGDIAVLNSHLTKLNIHRRQVLNDLLDLKGNIRVFCRVRPFLSEEKVNSLKPVIALDENKMLLRIVEKKRKQYNFDKVFHPHSTQEEVFNEIEHLIKSALDGHNVCIFAYGQTGTGKTFSMEGKLGSPGVVPRVLNALFGQDLQRNEELVYSFSMLEIYMGNLRDLLVPRMEKPSARLIRPCLSIKTDCKGCVEIANLVSIQVQSVEQVKRLYKLGSRLRSTASTMSNATSSRSHCLTRIFITSNASERRKTSKIWMIDLGGSERLLKTHASGRRLDEGKAINLSLSALGDVINALQQKKPHIPYRNSKLTQVLKDSLGEDSKTLMLVHVSPKEDDLCETVCSLGFATRAKSIHLGQEESLEAKMLKEEKMAEMLQRVSHLEDKSCEIKKHINELSALLKLLNGSETQLDHNSEEFPVEEVQYDMHVEKQSLNNRTQNSKLPRFMRSTVSSQKKKSPSNHTNGKAKKKPPVHRRRQKCSSVYAESVTNQEECTLQNISEYGLSRTVSMDWKNYADTTSEFSQDASECMIKTVVFSKLEKSPSGSVSSICSEVITEPESYQAGILDMGRCATSDDWSYLQTAKLITEDIDGSGELDQEVTKMSAGQNIEAINNEVNVLKESVNLENYLMNYPYRDTLCKYDTKMDENSIMKAETDKEAKISRTQMIFAEIHKDIFCEDSGPQLEVEERILSPKDSDGVGHEVRIKTPILDTRTVNKRTNGPSGFNDIEDGSSVFKRIQRSLFEVKDLSEVDDKNEGLEKDAVPSTKLREGENTRRGYLLETVCASLVLGLGLESLGFEQDFFFGLTS